MVKKPIIDIHKTSMVWVYGKDLLRVRYQNGLSRNKICSYMNKKGYVYYPMKLFRYERQIRLELPAKEIKCLLSALKAGFQVKS